jgi:hypothetical protein
MRTQASAEADRASEVVPPIEISAPWRVRQVRVVEHGVIDVEFVDGTRGQVDMRPFLNGEKAPGTMFEPLRDPSLFSQARVNLGAIEWPGDIDLAPDAMYDEIRAHGTWIFG